MRETQNNKLGSRVGLTVFVVLAIAVGLWWMNSGYGKVSPRTYQFSKSLYTACQTKNELHLSKAEELLAADAKRLPEKELRWLNSIISLARDGKWESAAANARRMMEDQVEK